MRHFSADENLPTRFGPENSRPVGVDSKKRSLRLVPCGALAAENGRKYAERRLRQNEIRPSRKCKCTFARSSRRTSLQRCTYRRKQSKRFSLSHNSEIGRKTPSDFRTTI